MVPGSNSLGPGDSAFFLPLIEDGRRVQPVADYEGKILLAESAADENAAVAQRFTLWEPAGGTREPAWESVLERQDVVTGVDGRLAVFIRIGLALPFADWEMFVFDFETGETRRVAEADPAVATLPGLPQTVPFGLAPFPSLDDGRVVWSQYRLDGSTVVREIVLHELAAGRSRVVASIPADEAHDLTSPTISGGRLAWIARAPEGTAITVMDLASGETTEAETGESVPFAVALGNDGATLAWDDARGGKYALDFATGETIKFAGNEGWGITSHGRRFSWAPAPAYGGTGGFYDAATDELFLVKSEGRALVNHTALLDGWFAWQHLELDESGNPALGESGYYFFPLED